jgi:sugar/nucleoside kinase (ribokinase family)
MHIDPYFIDTVFLGCLSRETIINRKKETFIDHPGGNLLYSSFAHKLWGKNSGLLSRVGMEFSESWIGQIASQGFNTSGITRTDQERDHREFYFVDQSGEILADNPQKYFMDLDQPFPKNLLGYRKNGSKLDSRRTCGEFSLKPDDIPDDYFDCHNLALCPLDFISHSLIPVEFRTRNSTRIFFHAGDGYMHSSFFTEIPALVCGAELFFTNEKNAKALFVGKCAGIWEMLEFLSSFNIETSIIYKPDEGFYIYIQNGARKVFLPDYPVETIDPVGAEDAFFGGYVAGYLKHFDPVAAAATGSISASIKREGSTAAYLLDALPELAAWRFDTLISKVQIQ